jgi:O-antigen biosynthesis protein WbqV
MIADGTQRVGRDIGGVPVLGTVAELADIVKELDRRGNKPQRLILSGRGVDGAAVRRLLDLADGLGIPLARLPRLTEFKETARDLTRPIEPRPCSIVPAWLA